MMGSSKELGSQTVELKKGRKISEHGNAPTQIIFVTCSACEINKFWGYCTKISRPRAEAQSPSSRYFGLAEENSNNTER